MKDKSNIEFIELKPINTELAKYQIQIGLIIDYLTILMTLLTFLLNPFNTRILFKLFTYQVDYSNLETHYQQQDYKRLVITFLLKKSVSDCF